VRRGFVVPNPGEVVSVGGLFPDGAFHDATPAEATEVGIASGRSVQGRRGVDYSNSTSTDRLGGGISSIFRPHRLPVTRQTPMEVSIFLQ
jgi:hypothetical protein